MSDDLRLFQREYVFVQEVGLKSDGLYFRLNPRSDGQTIKIVIDVKNGKGVIIHHFTYINLSAAPKLPAVR